jgi:hypothetical protein
MILHLDSTYRNILNYPNPAEFEIDFNGKPPPDASVKDVRGQYACDQYAQYSFGWVGDLTKKSDLYGIPGDTYTVSVIPLSGFMCILDPFDPRAAFFYNNKDVFNDYFVGLLMMDPATGQSSMITAYTGADGQFVLENTLFSSPYFRVSVSEMQKSTLNYYPTVEVSIVNPSFSLGNNLVILGSTSLMPSSPTEFILAKGLNTDLFVENVTKGWSSKVSKIVGRYRSVLLEAMPSYDSHDIFIVWARPHSAEGTSSPLFVSGVQDFSIQTSGTGYRAGDSLSNEEGSVSFEVSSTDPVGRVLGMRCTRPGSLLYPGDLLRVKKVVTDEDEEGVVVRVLQTGNWFLLSYTGDSPPTSSSLPARDENNPLFLVAFLNPSNFQMIYFSVVCYRKPVLYLNITAEEVGVINSLYAGNPDVAFRFFIIPFFSLYPNIIAPIVPYQNPTCYTVSIVSISLPNLPVCGFNVLLSDIPYVIVTLTNTNNDCYGTLVSNNPNSANANFICPIANIRNPDIVKFVVVGSYQKVVFKFTPKNSLRFRVSLPNGQLLKYSNTFVPYNLSCEKGSGPCSSINQPLNTDALNNNTLKVFPLLTSNYLSATFLFTPV